MANCGASMKPQQKNTKSIKMNAGGMAMGGGVPAAGSPAVNAVPAPSAPAPMAATTKYPKRAEMSRGGKVTKKK